MNFFRHTGHMDFFRYVGHVIVRLKKKKINEFFLTRHEDGTAHCLPLICSLLIIFSKQLIHNVPTTKNSLPRVIFY